MSILTWLRGVVDGDAYGLEEQVESCMVERDRLLAQLDAMQAQRDHYKSMWEESHQALAKANDELRDERLAGIIIKEQSDKTELENQVLQEKLEHAAELLVEGLEVVQNAQHDQETLELENLMLRHAGQRWYELGNIQAEALDKLQEDAMSCEQITRMPAGLMRFVLGHDSLAQLFNGTFTKNLSEQMDAVADELRKKEVKELMSSFIDIEDVEVVGKNKAETAEYEKGKVNISQYDDTCGCGTDDDKGCAVD